MPYDLSKPLVIGISSRALFNLEQENKIFEEQGVEAYEAYQVAHENEILQKGAAFQLIKAFLELNNTELGRLVEVIIMSRNLSLIHIWVRRIYDNREHGTARKG